MLAQPPDRLDAGLYEPRILLGVHLCSQFFFRQSDALLGREPAELVFRLLAQAGYLVPRLLADLCSLSGGRFGDPGFFGFSLGPCSFEDGVFFRLSLDKLCFGRGQRGFSPSGFLAT